MSRPPFREETLILFINIFGSIAKHASIILDGVKISIKISHTVQCRLQIWNLHLIEFVEMCDKLVSISPHLDPKCLKFCRI